MRYNLTKKDKLRAKLFKIPPPKDFTWDNLVSVMRGCGFVENCDSGSHYKFVHAETAVIANISKTHPTGILKRYQIEDAIRAINLSELRGSQ